MTYHTRDDGVVRERLVQRILSTDSVLQKNDGSFGADGGGELGGEGGVSVEEGFVGAEDCEMDR